MILLHNLKSVFHVLIIFQCLFFSAYLLSQKHRKRLSNIILAAFLLDIALIELGGVFLHFLDLRRFLVASLPHILYLDFPFSYLAAPLLYLYVLSITRPGFKLRKAHLFHLMPFVLAAALIILRYHAHSPETLRQMLERGSAFSRLESLLFDVLAYFQLIIYVAVSYTALKSYRAALKNAYSTIEKINLSWLSLVLSGLLVVRSLEVAEYAIWFTTGEMGVIVLYYLAQIVFLGFLIILFYQGLKQPEVFAGTQEDNHGRKYGKALLSEAQKELYAQKLQSFMKLEKPYLDPLLSLRQLSQKAAIPSHHLSQVLNTYFHQNFFDFVNSYRIKESQRLLIDPDNGKRTILAVVYETGFNSKSVFNSAFKKRTGMTPSEFRKQQN